MNNTPELPPVIRQIDLKPILRVDYSMEGDWNRNLKVVWSAKDGFLDYNQINRSHPEHKPCLELYFDGYWLGIHCYRDEGGEHVFDEEKADAILNYIEENR